LAQFTLPSQQFIGISDVMETGMRSRKSSSCSSSRTSRSRRKPEELLQEYGDYLQQVLTWLNGLIYIRRLIWITWQRDKVNTN